MPEDTSPAPLHLTEEELENYRNRTLPAEVVLTLSEHLAVCEACREQLSAALSVENSMARLLSSVQRFPEEDEEDEEHLDEDTLIAFSENQLSPIEREMVECHLEMCASCRFQSKELNALHTLMAAAPAVTYSPASLPSFWQRLLQGLHLPVVRQTLQVSGACLATAVLVFFFMKQMRTLSGAPSSENQTIAREQNLKTRETELARQQEELHNKWASNDEREKQVNAEQAKVALAKADFEKQKKLLVSSPLPASFQLPHRVQVAAIMPNAGVDVSRFQSDADKKQDLIPFALLAPLPGEVVRPESVTFRWKEYVGTSGQKADAYTVQLESDEKPVESDEVTTTEWTPKTPLEPGKHYSWTVFVSRTTPEQSVLPQSPVRGAQITFRTLSKEDLVQLQQASSSTLRLGATFAKIGMWKDAEQTFETYLRAVPNDTRAQEWLRRVRQQRLDWLKKAGKQLELIPDSFGAKEMREHLKALQDER